MKNPNYEAHETFGRRNRSVKTWWMVLALALLAILFILPSSLRILVAQGDGSLNAEVTFTKWVTTPPNMEGIVGGDVGTGTFAGEVLNFVPGSVFTNIEALYHVNGGTHAFSAHVFVRQNEATHTAAIRGVVTDGWLRGTQVRGNYTVISCPDQTNGTCFEGTLHPVEITDPEIVQVTTADGRILEAQYWALSADETPASGAPTVVVMHALYSSQRAGLPLVEPLQQAGYNVLFSDWRVSDSLDDVQLWFDWLRNQPNVRVDAISTLGSGVGSAAAIVSCANDDLCVTAIAVSPATSLPIPDTLDALMISALTDGLSTRSVLMIGTQGDSYADAENMIPFATGPLAQGEIGLRIYSGSEARESLFTSPTHADSVLQLIISWLNEHTPVASEGNACVCLSMSV